MVLDRSAAGPRRVVFGNMASAARALVAAAVAGGAVDHDLRSGVGECGVAAGLEAGPCGGDRGFSPMAGPSPPAPARISMGGTAHLRSAPVELARHVHQTPEVAGGEGESGPRRSTASTFLADDGVRIAGYSTQKVPPKPRQTLLPFERTHLETMDGCRALAGLVVDAELPQARAAVVIGGARRSSARDRPRDISADIDQKSS